MEVSDYGNLIFKRHLIRTLRYESALFSKSWIFCCVVVLTIKVLFKSYGSINWIIGKFWIVNMVSRESKLEILLPKLLNSTIITSMLWAQKFFLVLFFVKFQNDWQKILWHFVWWCTMCSLRTSDARYLQESFVFYDAIRTRKYFDDVRREKYDSISLFSLFFIDDYCEQMTTNTHMTIIII